jgi:hypothetical protein
MGAGSHHNLVVPATYQIKLRALAIEQGYSTEDLYGPKKEKKSATRTVRAKTSKKYGGEILLDLSGS